MDLRADRVLKWLMVLREVLKIREVLSGADPDIQKGGFFVQVLLISCEHIS